MLSTRTLLSTFHKQKINTKAMRSYSPQRSLEELATQSSRSKMYEVNDQGNTLLHEAAIACTPKEIRKLIDIIGLESASHMAKMINNSGELPIDVACGNFPSEQALNELHEIFKPLMLMHPKLKKLNEPITIDDYLKQNEIIKNSRLKYNLEIACEVANNVRSMIKASLSHPEINDWTLTAKLALQDKMAAVRGGILEGFQQTNLTDYQRKISAPAYFAAKYQAGNCYEFTCTTIHLFNKKDDDLLSEIFHLRYGDHCFAIIDRDVNKNDLGENAVISDAWSGKVYPAKELSKHLAGHSLIPFIPFTHMVTSFNTKFQFITNSASFISSKEVTHATKMPFFAVKQQEKSLEEKLEIIKEFNNIISSLKKQ